MSADSYSQSGTTPATVAPGRQMAISDILAMVLAPLASLKLTVFLLVLAVFVTFVGTLEQTRMDIAPVKAKYFLENKVFVEVPFEVFLVPAWFPSLQGVPGSIYLPSGLAILVLMILNMAAAHILRFRLQATGNRLFWGIGFAIVSALITWLIIFNAQNPNGLQGEPPISWERMWILLQIAMLAIACAAGVSFFSLPKDQRYERFFLAGTGIVFGIGLLLTLLLPDKGYIGDSAMRIVWQLAQATVAASISLVACLLLFKRKGGVVLLHLGVLGLMLNEIYVNSTNVEQLMVLSEGSTSSQAVDIRTTELAIIDQSDADYDLITVVPRSRLKQTGQRISDSQLPFDIQVLDYYDNSDILAASNRADNRATHGLGLFIEAKQLPTVTGVEMGRKADVASAYVQLFEKNSDVSLGTFLITQYVAFPELFATFRIPAGRDRVLVEGKEYVIELRHKTEYKPYSVTLRDVTAEYYLATNTPRYFSSDIIFHDQSQGVVFEKEIWMNNPMRYGGETFYQTGYNKDESTGSETSTLQIVTNRGWMIPYVCCMFTVLGLTVQFGNSLLGFLEKNEKQRQIGGSKNLSDRKPVLEASPSLIGRLRSDRTVLIPAILTLAGLLGLSWLGLSALSPSTKKGDLRLDLLGQIPITQNGRVQPLDSFARHNALQLSKREFVNNWEEKKQPAIRWLADTMFQAESYDQYRLFRIEDQGVLAALNLPFPLKGQRYQKSNLKYTPAEIGENRGKMRELLAGDSNNWGEFEKRIAKVTRQLQQVEAAELAMGFPQMENWSLMRRLEMASGGIPKGALPLVIPTDDPDEPWISFIAFENRLWLKELATANQASTTEELAKAILEKEFLPMQKESLTRARVIDKILASPDIVQLLQAEYGAVSPSELKKLIEERWHQIPSEKTDPLRAMEAPFVEALLADQLPQLVRVMDQQIALINGNSGKIAADFPPAVADLTRLRTAYLENDARTFNGVLENYLAAVRAKPPAEMSPLGIKTENWYNAFAPFYLAMSLYLIAMLLGVLSWVGWNSTFDRTAGGLLLLGLLVHCVGLIARIVISGRPPVTNLYSSFLFVSLVFVAGMMILERFSKLRIGYFLAGAGGFLALLIAWTMTLTDGDTFTVLVAVLDTQFWLATHVITISIGYGATMMAGFFGIAYIMMGLLTRKLDQQSRKKLGNVIYGAICFGLITSFFGTVLGGLWGDDSWGRFWGWDPKENGALMIVLWNAVALHARWAGMIRERGLALIAIFGNLITLWSWKGVNALGVGLHAYAGTEDKTMIYIILFGIASMTVMAVGLLPIRWWPSYQSES
jgi:ABC-type transport system involved in cytochrome c biogenesis permease subunit